MKCKIDPTELIMAILVSIFIFVAMIVTNDSNSEGRVQYDPPCSLEYQLTILEKLECENT